MVLKVYLKYAVKGSPEFTAKVSLPDAWLATEPCRSVLRLFVDAYNAKFPSGSTMEVDAMRLRVGGVVVRPDAVVVAHFRPYADVHVEHVPDPHDPHSAERATLNNLSAKDRDAFIVATAALNVEAWDDADGAAADHFVPYEYVLEVLMEYLIDDPWVVTFEQGNNKGVVVVRDTCGASQPITVDTHTGRALCAIVSLRSGRLFVGGTSGGPHPSELVCYKFQSEKGVMEEEWRLRESFPASMGYQDWRDIDVVTFTPWHMAFTSDGQWFFMDDLDSTEGSAALCVRFVARRVIPSRKVTPWPPLRGGHRDRYGNVIGSRMTIVVTQTVIIARTEPDICRDTEYRRIFTAQILRMS